MSIYCVIALALVAIIFTAVFGLEPAVQKIANGIADALSFADKGSKPHLFDLAVLLALLIALVGIVKVLVTRRGNDH